MSTLHSSVVILHVEALYKYTCKKHHSHCTTSLPNINTTLSNLPCPTLSYPATSMPLCYPNLLYTCMCTYMYDLAQPAPASVARFVRALLSCVALPCLSKHPMEWLVKHTPCYTIMQPSCLLIYYHTKFVWCSFPSFPYCTRNISPFLTLYLLRPTDLSDLKQLHPSVGSNLESLLTYHGNDFHDTFSLTFEVHVHICTTDSCIILMHG